jgi:hypothetical protein
MKEIIKRMEVNKKGDLRRLKCFHNDKILL